MEIIKSSLKISMAELLNSNTAKKLGIVNMPTSVEVLHNLATLHYVLNEVRTAFGRPLVITSGYRCPALNDAVQGVSNSYHTRGLAADIRTPIEWKQLIKVFEIVCRMKNIPHLIIFEKPVNGVPSWLHVQLLTENKNGKIQSITTIK